MHMFAMAKKRLIAVMNKKDDDNVAVNFKDLIRHYGKAFLSAGEEIDDNTLRGKKRTSSYRFSF